MTSLVRVDLSGNEIRTLPRALACLTNLESLELEDSQLKFLTPGILPQLKKLNFLSLSSNELTILPEEFDHLTSLHTLKLMNNQLWCLPKSLYRCYSLAKLDVGHNRLLSLSTAVKHLTNLVTINLKENRLTSLPATLPSCRLLEYLCAAFNYISEIPIWFYRFRSLHVLDLSNNSLSRIATSLGNMESLLHLNLSHNQIKILPISLGCLHETLVNLNLDDNPIANIPTSVLDLEDSKLILKYLHKTLKEYFPINRAKVIICGKAKSGKTSVGRHLANHWHAKAEGEGLEEYHFTIQSDRDVPKVDVVLWDFQDKSETFVVTHQFFLKRDAYYLLCFSLLDNQAFSTVDFWLRSLKLRCINPNVLLVATHKDRVPRPVWATIVEEMAQAAKNEGVTLLGIYVVNAAGGEGIPQLCSDFEKFVFAKPAMHVPGSFLLMEKVLEEYDVYLDCPIISKKEIFRVGVTCDLRKSEIMECMQFLHNYGKILFFDRTEEESLLIILDANWLFRVMCSLYSSNNIGKDGFALMSEMEASWNHFSPTVFPILLELMKKFSLAFVCGDAVEILVKTRLPSQMSASIRNKAPVTDYSDRVLIPSLLSKTRPTALLMTWWADMAQGMLQFERLFRFSLLPKGLFAHLVMKLCQTHINILALWRNGLLLRIEKVSAMVFIEHSFFDKLDVDAINTSHTTSMDTGPRLQGNEMLIQVRGDGAYSRDLFAAVLEILHLALAEFPSIEWERLVRFPEHVQRNADVRRQSVITPSQHTWIKLAELEKLYFEGEVDDFHGMRFEDLAPDICLANYTGNVFTINQILIGREVGKGSYSKVYEGSIVGATDPNAKYAIKVLKIKRTALRWEIEAAIFKTQREILIQSQMDHPNICKIVGICRRPWAIVMDYYEYGNLFDHLHNYSQPINFSYLLLAMQDVSEAISYMHSLKPPIIHRDIKTPNLLIRSLDPAAPARVQLMDMGSAQIFKFPISDAQEQGNPTWLAPERIKGKPYGLKADIYAFGVVCWECISRLTFFGDCRWISMISDRVAAGERPEVSPTYCPPLLRELIARTWHQKPKQRPDWPWVRQQIDQALKLSTIEDWDKISAEYYENIIYPLEVINKERIASTKRLPPVSATVPKAVVVTVPKPEDSDKDLLKNSGLSPLAFSRDVNQLHAISQAAHNSPHAASSNAANTTTASSTTSPQAAPVHSAHERTNTPPPRPLSTYGQSPLVLKETQTESEIDDKPKIQRKKAFVEINLQSLTQSDGQDKLSNSNINTGSTTSSLSDTPPLGDSTTGSSTAPNSPGGNLAAMGGAQRSPLPTALSDSKKRLQLRRELQLPHSLTPQGHRKSSGRDEGSHQDGFDVTEVDTTKDIRDTEKSQSDSSIDVRGKHKAVSPQNLKKSSEKEKELSRGHAHSNAERSRKKDTPPTSPPHSPRSNSTALPLSLQHHTKTQKAPERPTSLPNVMHDNDSPTSIRKDSKTDDKKKHRYSFGGRSNKDVDKSEKSNSERSTSLAASNGEFSTASTSDFGGISIREAQSNSPSGSNPHLLHPDMHGGAKTPPHRRSVGRPEPRISQDVNSVQVHSSQRFPTMPSNAMMSSAGSFNDESSSEEYHDVSPSPVVYHHEEDVLRGVSDVRTILGGFNEEVVPVGNSGASRRVLTRFHSKKNMTRTLTNSNPQNPNQPNPVHSEVKINSDLIIRDESSMSFTQSTNSTPKLPEKKEHTSHVPTVNLATVNITPSIIAPSNVVIPPITTTAPTTTTANVNMSSSSSNPTHNSLNLQQNPSNTLSPSNDDIQTRSIGREYSNEKQRHPITTSTSTSRADTSAYKKLATKKLSLYNLNAMASEQKLKAGKNVESNISPKRERAHPVGDVDKSIHSIASPRTMSDEEDYNAILDDHSLSTLVVPSSFEKNTLGTQSVIGKTSNTHHPLAVWMETADQKMIKDLIALSTQVGLGNNCCCLRDVVLCRSKTIIDRKSQYLSIVSNYLVPILKIQISETLCSTILSSINRKLGGVRIRDDIFDELEMALCESLKRTWMYFLKFQDEK